MNNILNPKWILFVNVLPITILMVLYYAQFNIIESLLEKQVLKLWFIFATVIMFSWLINIAYVFYKLNKKQTLGRTYACIALLFYIPLIYIYGYHLTDLLPRSVPNWMLMGNIFLYLGTFLMPTLCYALFVLVLSFTRNPNEQKPWLNFLKMISIPIIMYVFVMLLIPLWERYLHNQHEEHFVLMFFIIGTLAFLFFLIKWIYLLNNKKNGVWIKYAWLWKVPLLLIAPITGLILNNGFIDRIVGERIFGDFSHPIFYCLSLINGLLLCLPYPKNIKLKLIQFLILMMTLSYSIYFFIVFIVFLPLSIVAIIVMGVGVLMLVPLVVFIVHIKTLNELYHLLLNVFSKKRLILSALLVFLILPITVLSSFSYDRLVLNQALSYVYHSNYNTPMKVNVRSLNNTLEQIKSQKKETFNFYSEKIPYISSLFNWIVLDNLTLSNKKIDLLQRIFITNDTHTEPRIKNERSVNTSNTNVNITNLSTRSTYDEVNDYWTTWVDLEITNSSLSNRLKEFSTQIQLSDLMWISDYYLYVGDKKEKGILSEKKAALWIYNTIRNTRRDPGILYYTNNNQVNFNVYPFLKNETRKTGIEFIHKTPVMIKIADKEIWLGEAEVVNTNNNKSNLDEEYNNEYFTYVNVSHKEKLTPVQRQAYFHFIIDNSNRTELDVQLKRMQKLIDQYPELITNSKFSIVDSSVNTQSFDFYQNNNWQQKIISLSQHKQGGFYLDRVIKQILFNQYQHASEYYPVMIVLTDQLNEATLMDDLKDWEFTMNENNVFYSFDKKEQLLKHVLISKDITQGKRIAKINLNQTVLTINLNQDDQPTNIRYISNNKQASLIIHQAYPILDKDILFTKGWRQALELEAIRRSNILDPSQAQAQWLQMLRLSFSSNIMSAVTSFIVVENEAQKQILYKKQKQAMSAKSSFDLSEDTTNMSEPKMWMVLILFLAVIVYRKKRNTLKQGELI
ncbi:MAG: MSEP-CTERM sorting domain-containing protein [Saccharospirillaceae bacterium]|nr:MSEP-CTERM sorting domain-containing protein [Pseudomonadales bacterium]NRB77955.1 MSEP-CTERM sorting domain-containing protein [Saccharospirillaceae bacterium]